MSPPETTHPDRHSATGRGVRLVALSALSAFAAPAVFFGIIVLRKAERRGAYYLRGWKKRLDHEIARWS